MVPLLPLVESAVSVRERGSQPSVGCQRDPPLEAKLIQEQKTTLWVVRSMLSKWL